MLGAARPAIAGDGLAVKIAGLRSSAGVVRCGLFSKPENFPRGKVLRGTSAPISAEQATCLFPNLSPGRYAIAVFHASHNERKMPRNLLGIPQEGYGFSNNPAAKFGAPSFDAAAVPYAGGAKTITIDLNYR
jgi:uncharacterized protein (DUF2141 family)